MSVTGRRFARDWATSPALEREFLGHERAPTPPNPNRTRPTEWADAPKKKARYGDIAGFSDLVAWDGIEPSTRGFSIRQHLLQQGGSARRDHPLQVKPGPREAYKEQPAVHWAEFVHVAFGQDNGWSCLPLEAANGLHQQLAILPDRVAPLVESARIGNSTA